MVFAHNPLFIKSIFSFDFRSRTRGKKKERAREGPLWGYLIVSPV